MITDSPRIFDFKETKKRFGSAEIARKIFDLLQKTLQEDVAALQKYEKENDIDLARSILHKIEGGLLYASVPGLQKTMFVLHKEVKKTKSLHSIYSLFSDFYKEVEKFLQYRLDESDREEICKLA
jgi:HPt (histidine-containing phosphotransfer) domain-containing protein